MTLSTSNKSLPLPPGELGFPVIGESLDLISDSQKFVKERGKKYGDIFKTNIFNQNIIYIIGSDPVGFLMKKENQYLEITMFPSMEKLLGSVVANQMGDIHKSRRQIIAQAFKPRALQEYHQNIINTTNEYLQKWQEKETFAWYPELSNYTFDVGCNFLIGLSSASNTSLKTDYENFTRGLFSLSTIPLPWTNFGKAFRSRNKILAKIEQIINNRSSQKGEKSDALSILLSAKDEQGNNLGLEEVKEQTLNLLFGGHSTLTSALSSFCLLVAQHPQVLTKLQQEQDSISEPISLDTLEKMTYLDMVIQEVLRLIPPVGGSFRRIKEDFELNGYHLPKGWLLVYDTFGVHQNENHWQKPQDFNPDRFAEKTKPFTHIPFGGGMRECLGKEFAKLEIKIFTASLMKNYQWSLLPDQDLSLNLIPVPRPKDNLKVHFQPRN